MHKELSEVLAFEWENDCITGMKKLILIFYLMYVLLTMIKLNIFILSCFKGKWYGFKMTMIYFMLEQYWK